MDETKLSQYVSLDEFTHGGLDFGIPNILPPDLMDNAIKLCTFIIDPIRTYYSNPVIVHSGYRCPELNAKVGGVPDSDHQYGNSIDFTIQGVSCSSVFNDIVFGAIKGADGLPIFPKVDQIIYEFGGAWIHISHRGTPRNQKLEAVKTAGVTHYRFIDSVAILPPPATT